MTNHWHWFFFCLQTSDLICLPPALYCKLLFWLAFSEPHFLFLHEVVSCNSSNLLFQLEVCVITCAYSELSLLLFFSEIHYLHFWWTVLLTFIVRVFFLPLTLLNSSSWSIVSCRSLLRSLPLAVLEVSCDLCFFYHSEFRNSYNNNILCDRDYLGRIPFVSLTFLHQTMFILLQVPSVLYTFISRGHFAFYYLSLISVFLLIFYWFRIL